MVFSYLFIASNLSDLKLVYLSLFPMEWFSWHIFIYIGDVLKVSSFKSNKFIIKMIERLMGTVEESKQIQRGSAPLSSKTTEK